jgi:hypothetical protein
MMADRTASEDDPTCISSRCRAPLLIQSESTQNTPNNCGFEFSQLKITETDDDKVLARPTEEFK